VAELFSYWPLMLTLSAVGAIAGLTSGLFGIGGGSVMVPVLFYAFISLGVPPDVVMHCAVATSSSVIIVNAIRSVKRLDIACHSARRRGASDCRRRCGGALRDYGNWRWVTDCAAYEYVRRAHTPLFNGLR